MANDDLITAHVFVADELAAAFARRTPPGTDRENLVGCAREALVIAARDFDSSRDIRFENYAGQRIWWALLDEAKRQTLLSRRHIRAIRAGETFTQNGIPAPEGVRLVPLDEADWVPPRADEVARVEVIDRRDGLKRLSARELFALLAGGYGYTQEEIGEMLGISYERVGDIQALALHKAA